MQKVPVFVLIAAFLICVVNVAFISAQGSGSQPITLPPTGDISHDNGNVAMNFYVPPHPKIVRQQGIDQNFDYSFDQVGDTTYTITSCLKPDSTLDAETIASYHVQSSDSLGRQISRNVDLSVSNCYETPVDFADTQAMIFGDNDTEIINADDNVTFTITPETQACEKDTCVSQITITNLGTSNMVFQSDAMQVTLDSAASFEVSNAGTTDLHQVVIAPQSSATFTLIAQFDDYGTYKYDVAFTYADTTYTIDPFFFVTPFTTGRIYAGGSALVVSVYNATSLTLIGSTSSYGGNIRALFTDAGFIYVGGDTTQTVNKYNKTSLTSVANSTNYGGNILGLAMDSDSVYAGGSTNNTVKKYNKSMALVATANSYGGSIFAVFVDDIYVYAGGDVPNTVNKYNKSSLVNVGNTTSYGGVVEALFVDDKYIYAAGATNQSVVVYNKTSMAYVGNTANMGGIIFGLWVDNTSIYAGGGVSNLVTKFNKTTFATISSTTTYGGVIHALYVDNSFIYVGGVTNQSVIKYNKTSMAYIGNTPSYGGNINALIGDFPSSAPAIFNITITSPANQTNSTAKLNVSFTASLNNSAYFCELYLNSTVNKTNSSVSENVSTNFYVSDMSNVGAYTFNVECSIGSTIANSSSYLFTFSPCVPFWVPSFGSCLTNDSQFKTYTDSNFCGSVSGLPADNGTYTACNYCSENITTSFGACYVFNGTGLQSIYYADFNYWSCCVITGLVSDCSIKFAPYNMTGNQSCNFTLNQFNLEVDDNVYFGFGNDKVYGRIWMNNTNINFTCITSVQTIDHKVIQQNPAYLKNTDSFFFSKQNEDRQFFNTENGLANVYWTNENLVIDGRKYIFGVECAGNNTKLDSEHIVTVLYKPVNSPITRLFWATQNTNAIMIILLFAVFLVVIVSLIIWRLRNG